MVLKPLLREFGADALRAWAAGLGIATFVGSSGRVFPTDMKAAPLLRAWLHRLRALGLGCTCAIAGWAGTRPAPCGSTPRKARSPWKRGPPCWRWRRQLAAPGFGRRLVPWLQARGVELAPLRPSNCGFDVGWSEHFRSRHAGEPLKSVAISFEGCARSANASSRRWYRSSLVYATSAALRECIARDGAATFELDLLPHRSLEWVTRELAHPRGPRSLSTHLKTRLHLSGVKAGLLWSGYPRMCRADPARFAATIKALPIASRRHGRSPRPSAAPAACASRPWTTA